MTTLTISQAAAQCQKAPKVLIDQLTAAYPATVWGINSEVPADFLASLKKHAKEYDGTPAPSEAKAIGAGQLTVTESADLIVTDAGFEYGVMEAIREVQLDIMSQQGYLDGVELVEAYRDAKEEVITNYLSSEFDSSKSQLAQLKQRKAALTSQAAKKQARTQSLNSQAATMKAELAAMKKAN